MLTHNILVRAEGYSQYLLLLKLRQLGEVLVGVLAKFPVAALAAEVHSLALVFYEDVRIDGPAHDRTSF
jgi:hypothetical protein